MGLVTTATFFCLECEKQTVISPIHMYLHVVLSVTDVLQCYIMFVDYDSLENHITSVLGDGRKAI